MGRAFSFSLIAHAVFVLSFLLLSSTRTPLVIPRPARPVRLVTYLEPPPAPPRTVRAAPVSVAPSPPAPPAPRAVPPPAAEPPTTSPSRVQLPAPAREPPTPRKESPPSEARPDLSQRLARRLAATSPAAIPPRETEGPQIAAIPRTEPPQAAAPATEAPAPEGAPAPGAIAPVGHFPHAWYLAVLKEKVFSRWSPPSALFLGKSAPAALVSFRIERDGRVGSIALKESSGSARFDHSALAAVRGLGRVPALPEQYLEESLDVVIRFQNEE